MRLLARTLTRLRTPLWRLFLSYLLLLIVPTCGVFILYSARFIADYGRSLRADSDRNLQNLGTYVEEQVSRLWSTVSHASSDAAISQRLSFRDIPAMRAAQKALGAYKAGQPLIKDIGIYLPSIGRLLTSTSIAPAQDLPFAPEALPERLRQARSSPLLFASESNAYFPILSGPPGLVLLAFPYPLDTLFAESFILVVLDREAIALTLARYFPRSGSSATIYGGADILVASVGETGALERALGGSAGREAYHLSSMSATTSLFRYYSMVSETELLEPLRALRRSFILILLATLLVGFVLVYAFMVVNYSPIRKLRGFIELKLHAHSEERDELLAIERAVEEHSDDIDRIQHASAEATREHVVTRLVQGQIHSLSEVQELASPEDPLLVEGCFRSIILALPSSPAPDFRAVEELVKGMCVDGVRALHMLSAGEEECLAVVVANSAVEISAEELTLLLRGTQEACAARLGARPSVGVGECCRTPAEIGRSYLQARACLDYTLVKGRGEIVFFDELPRVQQSDGWSLAGPLSDLAISVREGDGEAVESTVGAIVDRIKAHRYPLFVARCMCFDLINTVVNIARDCGMSLSDSPQGLPGARLDTFRTIDDLSAIVRDFSAAVRRKLEGTTALPRLGVEARAYIHEHFAEPDFYIQALCARLGTSPARLSQVFRKAYGTTMVEYISRLRIEEAQRLLAGTAMGIDEIVRRIGYADRSSFTRKFRTRVGLSPGAFRKKSREEPWSPPAPGATKGGDPVAEAR